MPPKRPTAAPKPATTKARKREHDAGPSGDSPVKKRDAKDDASNRLYLVGFTAAEITKYKPLLKDDWAIDEILTDSITHVVLKSMGALKHSQQLLPIYWAVLKGIWLLKPSFLPTGVRRRSGVGGTPLQDEKEHEYDGKELDANHKAKADYPSMTDIVRIGAFIEDNDEPILGSEPFQKVSIVCGRSKDAKQRKEELRLVMQAAGATVLDDAVLKTWKAKRKKGGDVERPSMIVIVNGEANMSMMGLDDETIRDLLKARAPLFYEEFITTIFMHTMKPNLDDLLLQSFVFIHEQMKSVDPDGKLQARVMGEEESEDEGAMMMKTPAARRANSRVASAVRELSGTERKEKKTKREEEVVKMEEEEEEVKVADAAPKRGRPRKEEKREEEKMGEETPKAAKKEVKRGEPSKAVEKKEVKEEEMEKDDVDPDLVGEVSLADFHKEIDDNKGRGGEGSEQDRKEMDWMRKMRGDDDGGVMPEPIIFSQDATQPPIQIPEDLLQALTTRANEIMEEERVKEEEDEQGSEGSVEFKQALRKKEEEEETPKDIGSIRLEAASEYGAMMSAANVKESETCNPLGTQHLYINQQSAREIYDHFASPRLDWTDHIVDVQARMPWIRNGRPLRPACAVQTSAMQRQIIDLFYSFYHELDETGASSLLAEINSSDAMEMYECEYEEQRARRPPLDLMIKMLHEFAVKRHSEDLAVPERACAALQKALPIILPSSEYGRHFWLTVLAGGSQGIKGRAVQVVEEMAKRCKNFLIKALISNIYHAAVVKFVVYYCEVDLLCAQTPVVEYELSGKKKEEAETAESQTGRRTRAKRESRKKRNPLDKFPLVLLLVMELDEEPKKGLSESAVLVIQTLMKKVAEERKRGDWYLAASFNRALLCLLEAARWHCAQAASTALTGAERRRMKAAEAAGEAASQSGTQKVTVELAQTIQRVIRWFIKRGVTRTELRDILTLGWLEDILATME